jgi:acetoacetyl-CoA synthetase
MKSEILWSPPPQFAQATLMAEFMALVNEQEGLQLRSFQDFHRYSVENLNGFWSRAWDFLGVCGDKGAGEIVVNSGEIEKARFFPDASLNFAENLLARDGDAPAILFRGEDKAERKLSWSGLRASVSQLQQLFEHRGVGAGDRVAALTPNMPEAVIGLLAASSIGAVFSSASPDFGVQGVLDRFGQIEPKVLIACDGYYYNGKVVDIGEKIGQIMEHLPSVELLLIVPYAGSPEAVLKKTNRAQLWPDALSGFEPRAVNFRRLPFSHPVYILYSSGTTGIPKCIVHSAGGALIQHMKEHQLHCDLRAGETLFYFSTCGWMMWNWLVSGLASGATLALYDGSPFHPSGNILFDYADEAGINVFGTSAKYIDALKKAGLRPRDTHSLASVRMMTSTGSPLVPESFDYVYDAIKPDLHLASISGGTDICSCFVLGNPISPVYRGEIQGPGLGLAVDVYSESGQPVESGKGELVCTRPFPAMPAGFWNDPDGMKYHNAYFARFDNVWHHGDFAEWTPHGGIIIHGRSDATLNPGGVRIGTAEIYRQVEQLPEIRESIVIGQDYDNDVRVVLFVVLQDGFELDDALKTRIKTQIRNSASPRHVPALILQVPDIPRTKSGKITEIAVRDIVHGREVKNVEALANPQALDYYRGIAELGT